MTGEEGYLRENDGKPCMPLRFAFPVEPGDAGAKLGPFLRRKGCSASLLRQLKYEEEGLLVNGVRARTNWVLAPGNLVEITLPAEVSVVPPEDMPLAIVHESVHALVLNKPAGLVMHPTRSHKTGTLAAGFAALLAKRGTAAAFRPIGRLDADTSGLVLCAMNPFAAPCLGATLQKTYMALAAGQLPLGPGVVEAPLAPREDSAILQQVHPAGKPSRTAYEVLAAQKEACLVRVTPQTGRTHQIRVHFAHIGHPLLGDGLYGGDKKYISRHALHCGEISFAEPGATALATFCAPLPPDMENAAQALGLLQGG